jgi:hypothetical protein
MIQQGSEQEMRSELQHLEPQLAAVLQGTPVALHEPLYRLLCHSVPSTVKANGFRVLQALARFKEAAPVLLERLRATAAINPAAAVMESRGGACLCAVLCCAAPGMHHTCGRRLLCSCGLLLPLCNAANWGGAGLLY